MGYTIIHKKDKNKMAEMVEDILYTAGNLMHCVEGLKEDEYGDRYGDRYYDRYGDRRRYDMRDGGRYGDRGWEDDPYMERRRYPRY